MPPSSLRLRPFIPAILWAATIFVLSSFPGSAYPTTTLWNADKLVHIALYAPLGAFCAYALARVSALRPALIVVAAAALATVYGMSDELHQWFVPGRNSDWNDVIADGIGSLVGAAVTTVVAALRLRARRPAAR